MKIIKRQKKVFVITSEFFYSSNVYLYFLCSCLQSFPAKEYFTWEEIWCKNRFLEVTHKKYQKNTTNCWNPCWTG